MRANQFTTATEALAFVLAGNAHITLKSAKTGTRFTYRVRQSDDGKLHFVSVLTGSDNEGSYTYLGIIRGGHLSGFTRTKKSPIGDDAPSAVAFRWFAGWIAAGKLPADLEIWHEGRCGRCGRMLTVPESLAAGIGPDCAKRTGAIFAAEAA